MMKKLKSKVQWTWENAEIFAIYQPLLPPKQARYLKLYLEENLSLQEIADNFQVSKNAVHDAITQGLNNLEHWETHLNLQNQQQKIAQILQIYQESKNAEVQAILKILKE